jgi:lysophospholipase L1-like esterase
MTTPPAIPPAYARRPGTLGRLARVLVPGVRRVHNQVAPYAERWDQANAAAAAATGRLWVVMGDSAAQGVGAPSYDQGWVGQLRALLPEDWRVLNWSRSGARVQDVLDDQLPRLATLDVEPDLITVAIGANDVYKTPLDEIIAGLRRVMAQLPKGAVIATIPQGLRPRKAMAANAVIRAEAPPAGLRIADVWARTGPPWRGKFAEDNFHPATTGYADWAAAFAETLGLA